MARQYKEDSPINTITKIRSLLGEIGVINYESFWGQPYEDIYSVRIQDFEENGEFGTNGKGTNRVYTLASAWAEYIERLQNGFLTGTGSLNRILLKDLKKETGCYFFPDEKFLTKDEFKSLPAEFLKDIFSKKDLKITESDIDTYFNRLIENGFPGVLSVPFYDYNNGKIVYLPLNITLMITGSNGMAAGNTVAEGTFQGICELLERYAASIIYYNELTPPSISMDYLKKYPKELKMINNIKANGYDVIVKDFSANMKLPVLALLIVDRKKQMYRLNVGSETSFSVALSRVLTEIHQGSKDKEAFEKAMLPIPTKRQNYFIKNDDKSHFKRRTEFKQFVMNGSGTYPNSLFGKSESYKFDEGAFVQKDSYEDEVKYLLSLISKDLGQNIFLRDTSFLGFPSFFIYIPNLSARGVKNHQYTEEIFNVQSNIAMDKIEDLFFPFNNLLADTEKIKKLIPILTSIATTSKGLKEVKMKDSLKLEFKNDFYWDSIPLTFFLTGLSFLIKDFDNAINYLEIFMDSSSNKNNEYYKNVLKYFKLLKAEKPQTYIDKSVPSEVVKDFSTPESIFSGIDIPNCPNCDKCLLSTSCLTKNKVSFSKPILLKQKDYMESVSQEVFSVYR